VLQKQWVLDEDMAQFLNFFRANEKSTQRLKLQIDIVGTSLRGSGVY